MAPREAALESPVETSRGLLVAHAREERGPLNIALFIGCSVAAHALGWGVLSALPSEPLDLLAQSTSLAFDVLDEPPLAPLPEPPVVVPEPPPPTPAPVLAPTSRPRIEDEHEDPAPIGEDEDAPPTPDAPATENVGVTSTAGGLAVNATEGGGGSGPLAIRVRGGRPVIGEDEATEAPAIDHRRLARDWMASVNRVIMERAIRDYPRAARRAHLEGTVVVSISVAPDGRITTVAVARGAGNETLDGAALAAVRAVGSLPTPPDIFNRRHRPLTMPISYRFQ